MGTLNTWTETLVTQHAAGSSLGAFTTAKTVINPQALLVLRAGFFIPGKRLRISVQGGLGTLVTTPGTVVFQVMLGANIAFTTGTMQLNATAHTNIPFDLRIDLTCRAEGSGTNANLMGQAVAIGTMFTVTAAQIDGVNSQTVMMAPKTAAAVGAGFDSTIDNILDFFAGFSINDNANTVKIEQYTVEALN